MRSEIANSRWIRFDERDDVHFEREHLWLRRDGVEIEIQVQHPDVGKLIFEVRHEPAEVVKMRPSCYGDRGLLVWKIRN